MYTSIKPFRRQARGFGLIELLVTISILAFLIAVVFTDYGSFNSAVVLRSQAFEIALSVREAQQQAVAVVGGGGDFRKPYGIYIAVGSNTYNIFRDVNGNGVYDLSDPLEYVQEENINPQFTIRDITVGGTDLSNVSIMFIRPNFDAFYGTTDAAGVPGGAGSAEIGLSVEGASGTGPDQYKKIIVTSAGLIEVQ